MKQFQCQGLTDVLATVNHIIKQGGEIDINTVGGTRHAYYDYSFTYFENGQEKRVSCKGRVDLVRKLQEAIQGGADIKPYNLSALGGRTDSYWFKATMPEEKPVQEPEPVVEEPKPFDAAEFDYESLDASPAASDLMRAHKLNPADVKATGKGGRFIKSDVVAYLDSLK